MATEKDEMLDETKVHKYQSYSGIIVVFSKEFIVVEV